MSKERSCFSLSSPAKLLITALLLCCALALNAGRHHQVVVGCVYPFIDRAVVHSRVVSEVLGNEVCKRRLHPRAAIRDDGPAVSCTDTQELLLQFFCR